jgi:hypothetical protein
MSDMDNKNISNEELNLDVSDEIVVKDEFGNFKVLISGQLQDYKEETVVKKSLPAEKLFTKQGLVNKEVLADQLMPPTPVPWKKQEGAAFYFHPEDEEEVSKLANKETGEQINLEPLVEEVLKQSGLLFASEGIRQKVKNIITARLKHVREQGETRGALVRIPTEGGAGLSEADANVLLLLVSQKLEQIESGQVAPATENELDKLIKQADDVYDFDSRPTGDVAKSSSESFADNLVAAKPEFTKIPTYIEPPTASKPDTTQSKFKRSPILSSRPKLSDVTQVERVRGPIEELKYINLSELHRIGTSALDNIARIKDKIDALEEESFNKKVEGIKAWRHSPLYNLYLDIGRQSMEQGKSVSQVIMERDQLDKETLTLPEFEKVSDLNQELRY